MIRYLSVDGVVQIHDSIVPCAILDHGLLESAVLQPRATYLGAELYESIIEKSAALLRGLARNHAFEDGNKRTAWSATQVFLAANGAPLYQVADKEAADFVEQGVVVQGLGVPQIAEWLIYRQAL